MDGWGKKYIYRTRYAVIILPYTVISFDNSVGQVEPNKLCSSVFVTFRLGDDFPQLHRGLTLHP